MTKVKDLINYLIEKYGYEKYLEIGAADNNTFNAIKCKYKIGVEPFKSGGTHRMKSNDFFHQNTEIFDVVFIDGLHWCHQVLNDIHNSLKCLSDNGIIVVHDCNPTTEEMQLFPQPAGCQIWNGDVWKSFVHIRGMEHLDAFVFDIDHGCGIIRKKPNNDKISVRYDFENLTWNDLTMNKQLFLRLTSIDCLEILDT